MNKYIYIFFCLQSELKFFSEICDDNRYKYISTDINIYQRIPIYMNRYTNIYQQIYQYISTDTNIYQQKPIYINRYQYISTDTNIYQQIPIYINRYQYMKMLKL